VEVQLYAGRVRRSVERGYYVLCATRSRQGARQSLRRQSQTSSAPSQYGVAIRLLSWYEKNRFEPDTPGKTGDLQGQQSASIIHNHAYASRLFLSRFKRSHHPLHTLQRHSLNPPGRCRFFERSCIMESSSRFGSRYRGQLPLNHITLPSPSGLTVISLLIVLLLLKLRQTSRGVSHTRR
jgi:hypothetical protein